MTDHLPPGSIPGELDCLQLNRLRWQCRRGMLELDLVLERFLGENYAQLTARQRQEFETLLELEDHDLWALVSGRDATDDPQLAAMIERLREVSPIANFE